MHRRRRIRRALMPSMADMEVDGGAIDHSKPLRPAKAGPNQTNIEQLTTQLSDITISKLAEDAKKAKKPKYIDTSKLLKFSRAYSQ